MCVCVFVCLVSVCVCVCMCVCCEYVCVCVCVGGNVCLSVHVCMFTCIERTKSLRNITVQGRELRNQKECEECKQTASRSHIQCV